MLLFATIRMDLENIMLNNVSQTQKEILHFLTYTGRLKEPSSQRHRVEGGCLGKGRGGDDSQKVQSFRSER